MSTTPSRSGKTPSTRASLLARLRKGTDAGAWQLFVELYTPLVYQFARRSGLQDADSQDVTQKVMARVYRALGKFAYDAKRGRFRNWLGVIAIREIGRHRDRMGRPGRGAGGGQGDSIAERSAGADGGEWLETFNAHMLTTALDRIRAGFDDDTWQAFVMTWIEELETRQAAERLAKSTGWIYKARYRVLKRLRAEVEFLTEDAAILHRPH